MVDCGSPRCAQERRLFRRDLQVWGKKLPVVLGLERIAADYVDKETAKQLFSPHRAACNSEKVDDFEPRKRCFHCDKKLPNIYRRIRRIIDEAKRGKVGNGKICLRSLQDLTPYCLDFYKYGFGHELFGEAVKSYFVNSPQATNESGYIQPSENNIRLPSRASALASEISKSLTSARRNEPEFDDRQSGSDDDEEEEEFDSVEVQRSSRGKQLSNLRVPSVTSSSRAHRQNGAYKRPIQNDRLDNAEGFKALTGACSFDINSKRLSLALSSEDSKTIPDLYRKSRSDRNIDDNNQTWDHYFDSPPPPPYTQHRHLQHHHIDRRPLHHRHADRVEVVISDTEDEGLLIDSAHVRRGYHPQHFDRSRQLQRDSGAGEPHHHHCLERGKHQPREHGIDLDQQENSADMSTLDLFTSAQWRMRLEQLGQLEQMEHQPALAGGSLCSDNSLFHLANQHLLPPGLPTSVLTAAAAAAVTPPSPAALPFLLPFLPCSVQLKLDPTEEELTGRGIGVEAEPVGFKKHNNDFDHFRFSRKREHPLYFGADHVEANSFNARKSPPPDMYDMPRHYNQQDRLDQARRMHNIRGLVKQEQLRDVEAKWSAEVCDFSGPPKVSEMDHGEHDFYRKELKLPLLTDLVRKLVGQKFEEITRRRDDSGKPSPSCSEKSYENDRDFHSYSRDHAGQRRDDRMSAYNSPHFRHTDAPYIPSTMEPRDEHLLVAPTYKHLVESIYTNMMNEERSPAKLFGKVNEGGRVSDALKDIISKSINEKLQLQLVGMDERNPCRQISESWNNCSPKPVSSSHNIWSPALSATQCVSDAKDLSQSESTGEEGESIVSSPPPKRAKKENNVSSSSVSKAKGSKSPSVSLHIAGTSASGANSESQTNNGGKKTRPKRGQYRKYNSQLLMDAVKAVQRGEMSVHRAGSFYGVPHSTLEYKVKERHLLRQKKPRETDSSSESNKAADDSTTTVPSAASARPPSRLTPKNLKSKRTTSQDSVSSSIDDDSNLYRSTHMSDSDEKKHSDDRSFKGSGSPTLPISSTSPPILTPAPKTSEVASKPTSPAPTTVESSTVAATPNVPTPSRSPESKSGPTPDTAKTFPVLGNTGNNLPLFQPYIATPSPTMQQLLTSPGPGGLPYTSATSPLDTLAHAHSASELLRKLQHKVQAKGSATENNKSRSLSPLPDGGGAANRVLELVCGQDRGSLLHHSHHHGANTGASTLSDMMLYKQSA